jgi:imidazolonepropionase-like amidohydrolase
MQQFEQIYHAKQKTIVAYFQAGGKISLGTDHFSNGNYLAGFGAHRELDAFVRSGIPPVDAIRIGTINGATALGIEKDHGSIDVGKSADLFVITGNPLENIRHTRSVETVVRAGRVHSTAELLESIKGKLGPASEDEARDW